MELSGNPASRELGYCPCCGYQTLPEGAPGSEETCPVCLWTDDAEQFDDPAAVTDTNTISLTVARSNFETYGAVVETAVDETREPADERRDPNWPYDA